MSSSPTFANSARATSSASRSGIFFTINNSKFGIGEFINALLSFVIVAAVVYFFIVMPYNKARERFFPTKDEEEGTPEDIRLLEEIRDLLASGQTT